MDISHAFSRVVVSGDVVEVYKYSVPIPCGRTRDYEIVRDKSREEEGGEKRTDSLYRSRMNIRRLIWANQGPYTKFLTLTYAETTLALKKVHRDVQTFVQSMKRKGFPLKYVYVLEHQRERGEKEGNEGCLHVHMVVFVDRFIPLDVLRSCWKHGFVGIEKIDNVRNLGAYVCKYITKDNLQEFGKRVYSCSLGLNRGREEVFYTEGYSTTDIGLHPDDVLDHMDIGYHTQMRTDWVGEDGVAQYQTVEYYQGKWSDMELLIGEDKRQRLRSKSDTEVFNEQTDFGRK